jgi:hypothetical protein
MKMISTFYAVWTFSFSELFFRNIMQFDITYIWIMDYMCIWPTRNKYVLQKYGLMFIDKRP